MNTFKRDYVARLDLKTVLAATASGLRAIQRGASAFFAENAVASRVQAATGGRGLPAALLRIGRGREYGARSS